MLRGSCQTRVRVDDEDDVLRSLTSFQSSAVVRELLESEINDALSALSV